LVIKGFKLLYILDKTFKLTSTLNKTILYLLGFRKIPTMNYYRNKGFQHKRHTINLSKSMTKLDRHERQRLRALQEHLVQQSLKAGAEYIEMSTVAVIYHAQDEAPKHNVVIPHRGVAWTRSDDILTAFSYLENHNRQPHFQFLEKLFPEAFIQQLFLHGIKEETDRQIWLYEPVYGPSLPGETLYGRLSNGIGRPTPIQVRPVLSPEQMTLWREFEEVLGVDLAPVQYHRWLGYYNQQVLAGLVSVSDANATYIKPPHVKTLWHGLGLEKALLNHAVYQSLSDGITMIYTITQDNLSAPILRELGFIPFTRMFSFAR
jgi:hypothetical protein